MEEYKIIFAGSMGAGKTTSIQSLSDVPVVSTDVANTNKAAHAKSLTTVGIDYGQIMLPPNIKVGLYGTPGQQRFEFVWQMVAKGALGAVILIDSSSPNAIEELPYYVSYFFRQNIRNIVVGLTHTDVAQGHLTLDQAFELLETERLILPVLGVDAREKADVLLLVETLLASVEASLL